MNIGIRLHDVAGATLEEKLQNAKAQGFSCVHLALSKVLPDFPMEKAPELLTPALAAELKALFARYCLLYTSLPENRQPPGPPRRCTW